MMSKQFIFSLILILVIECNANLTSVTYPGIGTFTLTDFYDPIYRPIVLLPQSPEDMNATFYLYTPKNVNNSDILDWNSTDHYESTIFNPILNTTIITHGWRGSSQESWLHKLKNSLLNVEDLNVIIVGWPGGAKTEYTQAVANTRVIGIMIGILIENLANKFNISFDSFHLIGHSLGGHVVGYAGKHLDGRIGRISGLDPAGPFYKGLNYTEARLWHTDAKFVDVIHTDAQPLIKFGMGMYETCGHVDIYPNGGRTQPGCGDQENDEIPIIGEIVDLYQYSSCNHGRSHEYFIESITPPISRPVAYLCDSYDSFQNGKCTWNCQEPNKCVVMDPLADSYHVNKTFTQGKRYFMITAGEEPYFRYQYLIDLIMANHSDDYIGGIVPPLLTEVELRFINQDGDVEEFNFSEKSELFEDETEYPRLFSLDTNPEQLYEMEIKWSRGIDTITTKMNLAYINVTALSFESDSDRMQPMTLKFMPITDDGIPNDDWFVLEQK
nr:pancreatic lipase-related protein 2-like isoform X1 [Dermatophagoides farinae]